MRDMAQRSTPRFWLLGTAALIFGSHVSAYAQHSPAYHAGAPTMVAAAPALPSLSPEQIAQDVVLETNPRTGVTEFVAAPFDPFEEDPTLAASLRLRSADGATAIDGRPLRDGALVEIDFYYNSPSDDPYGGRNYRDAVFVNGEFAPVVTRDTRILECSAQVENLAYDHVSYYDPRYSVGVYRPYRHYAGHSGFGFGFGSQYFGPGYGTSSFFGNSRSFGNRFSFSSSRSRGRDRRVNTRRANIATRNLDAVQNQGSEESRRETARDARRTRREDRSRSNFEATDENARTRNARRRSARAASRDQARETSTRQNETRRERPRPANRENRRAASRETRRNEPASRRTQNRSNARSIAREKKEIKSRSRRRNSASNPRRELNFFPDDGYGGRSVVSARSVDCAREDKLRVFIPNARLDAARFDGLTLVALDEQGGETPIYLPPNYISGFRLATTGQRRSQGNQAPPRQSAAWPSHRIESAPCPAGTTKQPDGTCLQGRNGGYPTR